MLRFVPMHQAMRTMRQQALSLRGLSSSAQTSLEEMPKVHGTAGRYAAALYSAAVKTDSLDRVTADVSMMREMQSSSSEFNDFLLNPTLQRPAKVQVLTEVSQKVGFSKTFANFMLVVAESGRSPSTESIMATFSDMISVTKGKAVVKVTSTLPLSEWELALLKKNVKQRFFHEDSELTMETAIDESLLGGLTIQIGDKFMDLSTRTELRKLTEVIQETF